MKRAQIIMGLAGLALVAGLSACGTKPSGSAANPPTNPSQWVSQSLSHKTATFKIYAGENNGMNFNNYGHGDMTLTVPQNWRVTIDFVNTDNAQVHSAMIVPAADHVEMNISNSALAFSGASTPNPSLGTNYGVHQSFSFTANKTGNYAIACGIPGHAAMGMWDHFNVSPTATKAFVTTH